MIGITVGERRVAEFTDTTEFYLFLREWDIFGIFAKFG
jgi:hypothetical protein